MLSDRLHKTPDEIRAMSQSDVSLMLAYYMTRGSEA